MVQGVLQFGVGVLLARILPPQDFGVVALAYVVIGFAAVLSELGLAPAVVQRRDLTERHLRVSFTTAVAAGIAMAVALYVLAPLIGVLTRTPELPRLLRALALLFVAGGLGATSRGLLQRALDFRRLFLLEVASYSVGYAFVAVILALQGFGAWSLVVGALAQNFLASVLALHLARHSRRPLFATRELRDLLGFGAGMSLLQLVNYTARSGDNFVVGRWLGPLSLGLYSRAYSLMALPLNYGGTVISSVLFPAFSEINSDRERMKRAYLMSVQLTALLAAPVMAGMIVAAPHMVMGLYGPRWTGAVLPLQILCAAGLFRTVYHLAGSVAQASGQVYAELRRQVGYMVIVIGGSLIGTRWGLAGVAVGVGVGISFMYLAMAQLSLRIIGGSWRAFVAAQLPGVLLAGIVAAVTFAMRSLLELAGVGSLWIFFALTGVGAAGLLLGLYLLPRSVRPTELFALLHGSVVRLPSPLRPVVARALGFAG